MSPALSEVTLVRVARQAVDESHAHLAAAGRRGLEGMALWVGRQDGPVFDVLQAYIPKQQGLRTAHGLAVTVFGPELHQLNLWLYRNKLRLLAQVHSHPTEAYHSGTDDEYAIATTVGCFSLVVPDFATRAFSFGECAVYRLTKPGLLSLSSRPRWRHVAGPDVKRLFQVRD